MPLCFIGHKDCKIVQYYKRVLSGITEVSWAESSGGSADASHSADGSSTASEDESTNALFWVPVNENMPKLIFLAEREQASASDPVSLSVSLLHWALRHLLNPTAAMTTTTIVRMTAQTVKPVIVAVSDAGIALPTPARAPWPTGISKKKQQKKHGGQWR